MYPGGITQTDTLNEIVKQNKPMTENIIKSLIDTHLLESKDAADGVRYYMSENDIQSRNIYTYVDGVQVIDDTAQNNKLSSGFHKLLVDQKVAYLAGKPITVGSKSDDKHLLERTNEILSDEFEDVIPELVKNVSNKGREWLHPYIDEDGLFDFIRIPREEVIPIYDLSKQKKLMYAVRFYDVDEQTQKAELWDTQQVTYYEILNGSIYLDVNEEVNPAPHFLYGDVGYGWGEVPFVEFANNEERVSDLRFYKDYIDAYDLITSDTSNTLEEMQSLIYVLKGYEGTDLAEFVQGLKRYKAVAVEGGPDGGGVDTIQAEVPITAVDSILDRYTRNIFHFGQGADVSLDKFGNAPSGVALKQLFQLLDMKASVLERKFTKSLKMFAWFVVEYLNISEGHDHDYKDLTFTFNKTMTTNEVEQVQMSRDSEGIISKRTQLEQHPWVTDVESELKRLKDDALLYGSALEPLAADEE